jgi:FtsP/CotA-like multicopper oxidase with cupredoxin domain
MPRAWDGGLDMLNIRRFARVLTALALVPLAWDAQAQSFRVQCPTSTITHPASLNNNNAEPAYTGPTTLTPGANGYLVPSAKVNGAIKCQQISGGDGYATMGDGTQTYMFSFGPLSGLADMALGKPGTEFPSVFNAPYPATAANALRPGDPATTIGATTLPLASAQLTQLGTFYNGAIGLAYDIPSLFSIFNISETGNTVTLTANAALSFKVGDAIVISGTGTGYDGTWTVSVVGPGTPNTTGFPDNFSIQFTDPVTGLATITEGPGTVASTKQIDGHVDARQIIDVGVMNGNIPAPLMAIDEDDEFFLTLTNVGMIMRPDLFEQHTVHFHGYPNASALYDGVPDASVAINIGGSFTYYYLAPDAGTYFWHCHITPPEHLQMGMVGQIYVRPRQNRVPAGTSLYAALQAQQSDLRTACNSAADILCSNPLPAVNTGATAAATVPTGGTSGYAYNDGDGSTYYDVEYPLQIHGFDPNFHFVGMTFNPEGFADMKDKYFLLNGRSYPDTVTPGPLQTQSSDGVEHFSQPLPSIINIPAGGKALLRISDLDVSEYQTLASLGIPMKVIALNAKLLRDQAGNNLYYTTNSITLGGGESLDVILDASATNTDGSLKYPSGSVFYLYTPNLDHLSNDAENFGGLMTEVHIN